MSKKNYFPKDWEDFKNYVEEIEAQPHTYNTIADALTDTTVAFFNYFASKHGMTGFQASHSGLQVLGQLRNMKHPFMIVDSSKLLYPQYNLLEDVEKFLEESKIGLASEAQKLIDEVDEYTSKRVYQHWVDMTESNK